MEDDAVKRDTCETCKAFDPLNTSCRRKSPVPVPVPQAGGGLKVMGVFPWAEKNGWCLDHVPLPPDPLSTH